MQFAISVIDENDQTPQSTTDADWVEFRSIFPNALFSLLIPGPIGTTNTTVPVPPLFSSDGLTQEIIVNRDDGNIGQRSDWFNIVRGLSTAPSGSIVSLSIDNSGSMTLQTVKASYDLFKQKCATAGIVIVERSMGQERWIYPHANERATQTITPFFSIGNKTPGAAPFTITLPTSDSGLTVSVTVKDGTDKASINGNTITLTGVAGQVTLAANQSGDFNFRAATEVTTTFMVAKLTQTITPFASIGNKTPGAAPFTITLPTSDSGLTVSVTVKDGTDKASINGNTITLTGVAGQVTLAANQSGTANYAAAPEVTTSFMVAKLSQTIQAFTPISSRTPGAAPFTITLPTSDSGLTVSVTVKNGTDKASINGNTITLTGVAGQVTLAANQSGSANYAAAPEVTISFSVEFPVVATVRLRKNRFSTTEPYNEVSLAGGNFIYARWKKEGEIPAGLSWEGNKEGLRFWGTPTEVGTFTAAFEGPYLPNFSSTATVGSSSGDKVDCSIPQGSNQSGSISVKAYSIRFVVAEVVPLNPVIDGIQFFGPRTYGEALSGVLQGKLARRAAWGTDKRCIGTRPFTQNISSSSTTRTLPASGIDNFLIWTYTGNPSLPTSRAAQDGSSVYVLRNDQFDEDDILEADWVVSDSQGMTFPNDTTLDTVNALRQFIQPETSTDYAAFYGVAYNGDKWRTIIDAGIPLSSNSRSFGDFFLDDDFDGSLKISFWTSIDGRISTYPWARFGLKMFFGVMESGIAQYRNPDPEIPLVYDAASTSAGVFNSTLTTEGRRGVFNLTCAALPLNSVAKAHLKIIASK